MVIKCPNCNGALEYEPITNKMVCKFCNGKYDVNEFEDNIYVGNAYAQTQRNESNGNESTANFAQDPFYNPTTSDMDNPFWVPEADSLEEMSYIEDDINQETMQCNVYTCTACGSELSINGVESSTFCAYCGQPTIVFSRVSETLKPEYIIPFVITKDRAVELIRKRFKKGFFVPKEVKNFEIERLRGIYIPYWVMDIWYKDVQIWKGRVKSGKSSKTVYFKRAAETDFKGITLDASSYLNDQSSQKLEPYNLKSKKTFDIGYMQGYYSDRYDITREQIRGVAIGRAKELFDEEVKKTISASSKSIVSNSPDYLVKKATYMMLPAWFLTFRYEGIPYTILVNGQTGKVVGGLPYKKTKVVLLTTIITILSMVITLPISYSVIISALSTKSSEGHIRLILLLLFGGAVLIGIAFRNFAKVRKSKMLASEAEINKFVKNRQEEE